MTTQPLPQNGNRGQVQKATPPQQPDVNALLVAQRKQIASALPRHLTPDRFTRIALTELRKNPALGQCDPLSFLGAVIQAAQLGLEPGSGLGHAYLIPFNNRKLGIREVQFMVGYRGLIDLARRSGQVESIYARVVRERDVFEYESGDDEKIVHKPFLGDEEEAGPVVCVYAIAKLKGGGVQREVMSIRQINKVRERKQADNPVWDSDFDEMARKTVVRRLAKYLPLSSELGAAIEADDAAYSGESQQNWRVLSESYQPMPVRHDPDKIRRIQGEAAAPERAEADKAVALAELTKSVETKVKAGVPMEAIDKMVGRSIAEADTWSVDAILLAVDLLNARE